MKLKMYKDVNAERESEIISILQKGYYVHAKDMILKGELPLNITFQNGQGILHELVSNLNNNDLLQWLLENKFEELNLNAQAQGGSTPLMFAAINKNYDAIKLLLAYGADPDVENYAHSRLTDVVKSHDITAIDKVECLIRQAKEGILIKPKYIETKPNAELRQCHTIKPSIKSTENSNFSLSKLIKHLKTPLYNFKKASPETQPLIEKADENSKTA